MSDIRNFFGKKKTIAVNKTTSTSIPSSSSSQKQLKEIECELIDSDDDFIGGNKPERKRLKVKSDENKSSSLSTTNSITSTSTSSTIDSSSKKRKSSTSIIDLSDENNSFDSQTTSGLTSQSSDNPSPRSTAVTLTTSTASSALAVSMLTSSSNSSLPVLQRNGTKDSTKSNRIEIKGGVGSFFGETPSNNIIKSEKEIQQPKKIAKLKKDEDNTDDDKDDDDEIDDDNDDVFVKSRKTSPKKKKTPQPVVKVPIIQKDVTLSSVPPQGKEGCLEGYKIAFTGIMGEYLTRDNLEDLVKQYGAKLAQNVSGKTTLLVASPELEDGRSCETSMKYRNAIEKKIPIITEKDLLVLIQSSMNTSIKPEITNGNDNSKGELSKSTTGPSKLIAATTVSRLVKSPSIHTSSSSSTTTTTTPTTTHSSQLLWVDKYKPQKIDDIVGAGESTRKILDWLKKWPEVHLKKTLKIPFTKENPGAKSLLISGPPGIGKTTMATLIAKTLGYEVLEFNASDVRSKIAIIEQVSHLVHSQAMGSNGTLKKRVIIMDEVDGMGGSDRGGIPELIKVIKTSSTPIICVCNDRQERKIRTLANHCYDIRLRRPTKKMIADRLIRIGQMEGLSIEQNAAELLVEQMGNDIRQVINASQMWRAQSSSMKYRDLAGAVGGVIPYVDSEEGEIENESSGRLRGIQKDKILRQSPFDACGLILGGKKTDFHERFNSFFIDYSLLPLLIQQNYIDSSRNGIFKGPGTDAMKLEQLSRAADTVSDMELAGSFVRGDDMHWELLPTQAALCLKIGDHVQGFQSFPTFPQWLGKYSSTNKSKRLTQEIVRHTNISIRQAFDPIRLDYIPYLRSHLLNILKSYGSEEIRVNEDGEGVTGIDEVINILDIYGLSRDDLMETMKEMQFLIENDKLFFDRFESFDTKLKTAFTKKYNSMTHRSQALIEEYQLSKKRSRSKLGKVDEDEDGLEIGTTEDLEAAREVEEEKDSDNDEDLKEFMKKHSKVQKKSSSTTTTTSGNSKTSGSKRKK